MKMNEFTETIRAWSAMSFRENPFGSAIPGVFLYSPALVRTPVHSTSPRCLADIMQDGFAVAHVINDKSKTTFAEISNPILYSAIFHDLLDTNTLCPSNYVKTIIDKLDEQNAIAQVKLDFDDYVGYIARGLRAFASYIRELHLAIVIKQYLYNYSYQYEICNVSAQEDIEQHTDVKFRIGNRYYRVWSYQSTDKGLAKTRRRILNGCGKGYNILMPFDMTKTIFEMNGWYLYNRGIVFLTLKNLLTRRAMRYDEVVDEINANEEFGAKAQIFFV